VTAALTAVVVVGWLAAGVVETVVVLVLTGTEVALLALLVLAVLEVVLLLALPALVDVEAGWLTWATVGTDGVAVAVLAAVPAVVVVGVAAGVWVAGAETFVVALDVSTEVALGSATTR
jgi:hypothetical protein